MSKLFKDGSFQDNEGNVWRLDYFAYTVTIDNFGAGATQSRIVNFEADSDFMWVKSRYLAIEDTAGIGAAIITINDIRVPNIFVQINDSSSGRNMQNIPTPLSVLCPTPNLASFDNVDKKRFLPKSSLSLTFTNNDLAIDFFSFSLVGYKRFMLQAAANRAQGGN